MLCQCGSALEVLLGDQRWRGPNLGGADRGSDGSNCRTRVMGADPRSGSWECFREVLGFYQKPVIECNIYIYIYIYIHIIHIYSYEYYIKKSIDN